MIVDHPGSHFIFVYHPYVFYGRSYITYQGRPLTNKEYLDHWGKWIVLGSRKRLDDLAAKLDLYVEQGVIPCVKYDREPPKEMDLEVKQKLRRRFIDVGQDEAVLMECVMCVFCDQRQREEVWQILTGLGVNLKAWVYEKETIDLWLPGGILLERWIAQNCSGEDEAEKVRQESQERFRETFKNEDAIYKGWPQQ
ncbi:MAG: hypothetical protein VR68_04595 [Peptococcaceae bacterium BRH_c4a]|nr:MAG: hypothetical protein VR68_04595 [Peptococcaceae bacterium BRH_c4a]